MVRVCVCVCVCVFMYGQARESRWVLYFMNVLPPGETVTLHTGKSGSLFVKICRTTSDIDSFKLLV